MTEKKNKRGSGVDHPFGSVHPFTAGQKKIVEKMLADQRESIFSSGAVTVEQINIIQNLLDTKLEDKLQRFKIPVHVHIPQQEQKSEVNLMFPSKYFNWKDFVWASALGIIVGFIISNM